MSMDPATVGAGSGEGSREDLKKEYGKVWDTSELRAEFDVEGFLAPFVILRRKSDEKRGTMLFQHMPRFYFDWKEG